MSPVERSSPNSQIVSSQHPPGCASCERIRIPILVRRDYSLLARAAPTATSLWVSALADLRAMHRRRTSPLYASSLAGVTTASGTPAEAERQLRMLQQEWVTAEIKGDAVGFRRILDDPFVATFDA